MKKTHLISSPADRVQETIKITYTASTNHAKDIGQDVSYYNTRDKKVIQKYKSNLYSNLLGFGSLSMQIVSEEFNAKVKKMQNETGKSELEVQDIISEQFLKGEFESGNPYTISKEKIKLLLKGFDRLDKKRGVINVVGMRHGHKEGPNLSDYGRLEAISTGKNFDFENVDLLFGTHQTIIESILISLVGGSKGLTVQDARNSLPVNRQEPYKTAQATEFVFTKDKSGKKLTVISNGAGRVFTEEDVKKAYYFLSSI